jgi:hypothetical protein
VSDEYDALLDDELSEGAPQSVNAPKVASSQPPPSESSSRSEAAGGASPSVNAEPSAPQSRVSASDCPYDARPGQRCPACGKVHVRKGRTVKIHVPAGDVRTDFKKKERK